MLVITTDTFINKAGYIIIGLPTKYKPSSRGVTVVDHNLTGDLSLREIIFVNGDSGDPDTLYNTPRLPMDAEGNMIVILARHDLMCSTCPTPTVIQYSDCYKGPVKFTLSGIINPNLPQTNDTFLMAFNGEYGKVGVASHIPGFTLRMS